MDLIERLARRLARAAHQEDDWHEWLEDAAELLDELRREIEAGGRP